MINRSRDLALSALAAVGMLVAAPGVRADSMNLVKNGSFENNTGVGQINGTTTLADWNVGAASDGTAVPFAFVANANADSSGFSSVNSPPNIFVYGPGTPDSEGGPVNNGFTGSRDGGDFLGVDGDYAKAPVSQDISGLTIGEQYTLSFQWAGAQFTRFSGSMNDWWQVSFGGDTVTTDKAFNASHGFTGWMDATFTFTATSTTQTLSFLAESDGIGEPPFLLLDGVSLTGGSPTPAVPEPSTLLMLSISTVGILGVGYRRHRARLAVA